MLPFQKVWNHATKKYVTSKLNNFFIINLIVPRSSANLFTNKRGKCSGCDRIKILLINMFYWPIPRNEGIAILEKAIFHTKLQVDSGVAKRFFRILKFFWGLFGTMSYHNFTTSFAISHFCKNRHTLVSYCYIIFWFFMHSRSFLLSSFWWLLLYLFNQCC